MCVDSSLTPFATREIHGDPRTIVRLDLLIDVSDDLIEFGHALDVPQICTDQSTTVRS